MAGTGSSNVLQAPHTDWPRCRSTCQSGHLTQIGNREITTGHARNQRFADGGLMKYLMQALFNILGQSKEVADIADANSVIVLQRCRACHPFVLSQKLSSGKHGSQECIASRCKERTLPPSEVVFLAEKTHEQPQSCQGCQFRRLHADLVTGARKAARPRGSKRPESHCNRY